MLKRSKLEDIARPAIWALIFMPVLLCSYICWKALGGMPHIADETAYVFQARIFAYGKIGIAPPQIPEAFHVDHIVIQERGWYSVYPPGWPLLLAIGWILKSPWIVNPVVTATAAAGVYRLASVLYHRETAIAGLLFFLVSPFVLMMGAGFMSHMSCLSACVWCIAEIVSASKRNSVKHLALAGVFAGVAVLIRPFTAVVLLFPAVVWALWVYRLKILPAVVCTLPFAAGFMIYNQIQNGHPFTTGYEMDPVWQAVRFSPDYFFSNVIWYVKSLNQYIWGWPFPNLLLFAALLLPSKRRKMDLLIVLCSFSLFVAYSFFSYHDIVYAGPRYLFESIGFAAILAGKALENLKTIIGKKAAMIAAVLLMTYPLIFKLPGQIRYHSQIYHGQSSDFLAAVNQQAGEDALILLDGDPYVLRSFFFKNELNPADGRRVFCRAIQGKEGTLIRSYPRPETWRYFIELDPLPGPNVYTDRWKMKTAKLERIK